MSSKGSSNGDGHGQVDGKQGGSLVRATLLLRIMNRTKTSDPKLMRHSQAEPLVGGVGVLSWLSRLVMVVGDDLPLEVNESNIWVTNEIADILHFVSRS